MNRFRKMTALLLSGVLAVAATGCGSSSKNSSSTEASFTMWIYTAQDSSYYTDYSDNPSLQYAFSKTWGENDATVSIEFWVPAAGTASDNYNTMIASGDYPDILDGSISDSPMNLYVDGIILDLTEYVKEYMPNYMAYLEEYPEIYSNAMITVDGEEKIVSLVSVNDDISYYFCGPEYRRDWIVKYGTNPFTGEAFTGGYTDPEDVDSWEDDVVFPSGGSEPVYISDWEWMFEIFTLAMEDLGIEDSYCTSVYYPGFTYNGGLCSCFGGGVPVWYKDADGTVQFGGDSDQMRAYLQCLNTWYENGWLDSSFNERTSDAFYQIDTASVYQGKVGLWIGLWGQLGGRMDTGSELTEGICVYGAAWPINDIYGDESCQNVEPNCVTTTSLIGTSYYLTTAIEGKDISAILSYFDYFYSEEGALLHTFGLSAKQVEETGNSLYADWGMEDGAYSISEDGTYVKCEVLVNDSSTLLEASAAQRVPGLTLVANVDNGYAETYEASIASWSKYKNTGYFLSTAVTDNMTSEESSSANSVLSKVVEYMTVNAVDFIKGTKDINDDDAWSVWCTMLKKYNYASISEIYQSYVDAYSF